ncbi:MAG: hypothetical protein WBF52_02530 [Geitlerinemataceae cyanobacterium]
MNLKISNGNMSRVGDDRQRIVISIPQTRRRSIDVPFWIVLTALPILLLGMPARAVDRLSSTISPNIVSSLPQIAATGDENVLFPTPISARSEDDDKCIWLGVCN